MWLISLYVDTVKHQLQSGGTICTESMEIRQVGQQIVWCLNALLWMSSLIDTALIGCQCKVPLLSQYQSMASPQNIYSVILTLLSETIDSICFHVRKVLIRRLRWIFQVNRPKPPFIKINHKFSTDFWNEVHC